MRGNTTPRLSIFHHNIPHRRGKKSANWVPSRSPASLQPLQSELIPAFRYETRSVSENSVGILCTGSRNRPGTRLFCRWEFFASLHIRYDRYIHTPGTDLQTEHAVRSCFCTFFSYFYLPDSFRRVATPRGVTAAGIDFIVQSKTDPGTEQLANGNVSTKTIQPMVLIVILIFPHDFFPA